MIIQQGYQPMQFPLEIPIGKSVVKDSQPLPDRIIDLLSNTKLENIFNAAELVGLQNGTFSVSVDGKSFKIFSTQ